MTEVYVENVERVVTGLYSFSEHAKERLKTLLREMANRIAMRERTSLAGHTRSGRQLGSVRVVVHANVDRLVSASVIVGGGRRVRYAHAFELGFQGTQHSPEHERTSSRGRRFSVRAYEYQRTMKAHLYLDSALRAEAPRLATAIALALNTSARSQGFV